MQSTIFQSCVYDLYRYITEFTEAVPGAWNLEQKSSSDFLLSPVLCGPNYYNVQILHTEGQNIASPLLQIYQAAPSSMPWNRCLCPRCSCALGKFPLCFQVQLPCHLLQEAPLVKSWAESGLFAVPSRSPILSFLRVLTIACYDICVLPAFPATGW